MNGGRMTVTGSRSLAARTACSAASLLRPYWVTGRGAASSATGFPSALGPTAAREETYTNRFSPGA